MQGVYCYVTYSQRRLLMGPAGGCFDGLVADSQEGDQQYRRAYQYENGRPDLGAIGKVLQQPCMSK